MADSSKGYFVYMLRCADGSLYTGYTTDPERRLASHNSGDASKYTRARRPVTLVHLEEAPDLSSALKREAAVKKMARSEKLLLAQSAPAPAIAKPAARIALRGGSLPAFRDVKSRLGSLYVRRILAQCLFDGSDRSSCAVAEDYRRNPSRRFWGWVEDGRVLGICGFEVHSDHVEILHFAVAANARMRGIGTGMVYALADAQGLPVTAETDDDAEGFYRKAGFTATSFMKNGVRRWKCERPASPETEEQLRARLYPVILSEYNPEWPVWYAEERDNLRHLMGEAVVSIRHVGSTAVPGLKAKPIIDILLEAPSGTDFGAVASLFPADEYVCLSGDALTFGDEPLCVLKGYTGTGFAERVFHIHVREAGEHDEPAFRDYLISHPDAAAEYARLKTRLKDEFGHDRDAYTKAKGWFVKEVMRRARESAEK